VVQLAHKQESVNGLNLHYVTVGTDPAVEECGHWVFEENAGFIVPQRHRFWARVPAL
jgi:hypothetical protein